jgi:hypothetical protein
MAEENVLHSLSGLAQVLRPKFNSPAGQPLSRKNGTKARASVDESDEPSSSNPRRRPVRRSQARGTAATKRGD